MAALKRGVKLFIVRSLASFNTPSETVDAVQQEFGIKVTKQQCEAYDPTKRTGQNLGKEFCDEFWAARNEFLENPKNHVPIANLTVRLQHLQRLIECNNKNPMLLMGALEQAAKEVGGLFTNRKEITGKDGGPVQTQTETITVAEVLKARQELLDGEEY